jgi:catechol 2,3-dioxygenase-like lactoylglutathione lyase family enzyme
VRKPTAEEVLVETIVSNLMTSFEKGTLTRRELMQGLALIAAASGSSTVAAQSTGIKGARIDHVSIQVSDLPRSVGFYQKVFGFSVVSEDKPNEIIRLGTAGTTKTIVSLHHKNPTAVVDHFAIGLDSFNKDAVTRQLKQLGINPDENLDAGYHIKDPEGMNVQIV